MPARVLLLARELNLGGSERQMTQTARFLDRSRFEPRVGCFIPAGIRGDELRSCGVPVVQFPVASFKSSAAVAQGRALIRYIRDEGIQLVHSFDFPMNVFAIPLTRLFTRAAAVASQRSHRDLVPPGYRRLLKIPDRLAHASVVNCRYLERHMVEDEGVPAARVQVCHNGIDLTEFCPDNARRTITMGVICGLHPWKGVATLVDAFSRVRKLRPGMKLAIVGDGPARQDLETQARTLGIQDDVVFEPGTARVVDWLRSIEIFVLPSLSEAFSNSLMEAMACGCCAVASNVGGNPELIRHSVTGMLFEKGNAESLAAVLAELIQSAELRAGLAESGLRSIRENYSMEVAARRMGEIYLDLI